MKDLEPAALEALAALADEGGFERAAQRLSVTQSAISQRLRGLEAQVGQLLVVRSRPLQLTEAGLRLLRLARQWQALRSEVVRELGLRAGPAERLPIAVNADSLATWVLPALDPLVQAGLLLELVVDDQDFTHERLRQGAVLGCVSTVSQPLRGCRVWPLGVMRYLAVASPEFLARQKQNGGLHFSRWPFLVFNRKDDMQQLWLSKASGLERPRLQECFVPSSEASVRAAQMGWGVAVAPEMQVRSACEQGSLAPFMPHITLEVALYWHAWKLGSERAGESTGLLDQVGKALAAQALKVLEPVGAG